MARDEQKLRSKNVRQAILDTALEIGLEEGFEALSVRKIINKMRYSTGVVYHHFQDKQEIIDAIEAAETERMSGKVVSLLDSSKDIIENMTVVFHEIMLLALKEPEKYNLIVLHKYSRHAQSKPRWIEYIAEGIRKGVETGLMRPIDADKAAFSIWSSFLGFNLMISRSVDLTIQDAEALYKTQIQIIWKGLLQHE